jgi:predicted metal-dependent phosphoesterase TrpH
VTSLAGAERLDLHLHTTRSDGAVTEEALLLLAGQRRLDAIAITDHDQAPSLRAGLHDVAGRAVWLVHGAEVSAVHEDKEIHVLAFFPGETPEAFRTFLAGRRAERRERYVATRQAFGLETGDDVEGRAWTRFHLAQDLKDAGVVKTMSAAFAGPLRLGPFGVPLPEAVAQIAANGGLSAWAHPDPADAQRWAKDFARLGMWGLESARPGLGKAVRLRLQTIAHKAGLGITGGSDWHARGGDLGVFSFPRREARPFAAALEHRGSPTIA